MSSEFGAFIFSCLDDYGLDPYEFRLYARIQRRAGSSGKCYESVENMAKACLMSAKVARRSLASLQKSNLVSREDVPGSTSIWTLNPQNLWADVHTPGKNDRGSKNDRGLDINRIGKNTPKNVHTPGKNDRGSKNDRGLDMVNEGGKCPNLGHTPGKNDTPPLAKTTGEGIPSKVKKEINQETPCIPLLEPAASTPEEDTHTERCAAQEEEKAQEKDSSQSSSSLVKVQEGSVSESERSIPGQIVPAAGAAVEKVRERKYDKALGMCPPEERKTRRPDTPDVASLFPKGPWLTDGVQVNAKFLAWKASQFMKSAAFAGKSPAVVEGDVLCRWTKPFGEGAKNIFIDWTTYAKESGIHADSVQMRLDAGISITEAEQEEIVGKLPAIMSTHEPIAKAPNTPALMPQEAAQTTQVIECASRFSQRALEGRIEAPISATPTVTMSGVENGSAYQVFRADEKSVEKFAQVCQGPAQQQETTANPDGDRPPTPEELAENVKRIAQMMAKLTGKKSITRANPEPEKTEFQRLQTLVEFARRDPMTIAQVRAAEWRDEIEVDWNEEAETPYPISIKPSLGF